MRAAGSCAGGSSVTGAGSATAVAAIAGSAARGGAGAGGSSNSCSTATAGAGSGASTGTAAGGACGLIVLTSRGGPSTGAVGFGGSAFFASAAFLPPFGGAGASANMSPPGSAMLRCRATRSTNERATTSSIVLDALFSSIP